MLQKMWALLKLMLWNQKAGGTEVARAIKSTRYLIDHARVSNSQLAPKHRIND